MVLPQYTAPHLAREKSSYTPPRKRRISQSHFPLAFKMLVLLCCKLLRIANAWNPLAIHPHQPLFALLKNKQDMNFLFLFSTAYAVLSFAAIGVTAGAHRLWCHRSYKAKWPLRLLLCIMQTMAFQVCYIFC